MLIRRCCFNGTGPCGRFCFLLLTLCQFHGIINAFTPETTFRNGHTRQFQRYTQLRSIDNGQQDELDVQELQAEIDKIVDDPPMFASFNPENMDESALPIPTFTAAIVLIGSLVWTYLLFDIGINGFSGDI